MEVLSEQARTNTKHFFHRIGRKCPCPSGCWGPPEMMSGAVEILIIACKRATFRDKFRSRSICLLCFHQHKYVKCKKGWIERQRASLSLSAAAAWCITAVCSPILIADDKSLWDFYPALFKNTKFGLSCVSFAVTKFKIPARWRAFLQIKWPAEIITF